MDQRPLAGNIDLGIASVSPFSDSLDILSCAL